MWVGGMDFDSRGLDLVLLEEDCDEAYHNHWPLVGEYAFDRARYVPHLSPYLWQTTAWRNIVALGIEDPRGAARSADAPIYRTQGAILACLPPDLFVHPWKPSPWRKQLGIAMIGKEAPAAFALEHWLNAPETVTQDALDAFCIAWATRMVLVRSEAVA